MLETVFFFLLGPIVILVIRYYLNILSVRSLTSQLLNRRPLFEIPNVYFIKELSDSILISAVYALFCGIFLFMSRACDSFFYNRPTHMDWEFFWKAVCYLVWPMCVFYKLWHQNRYVENLRKALAAATTLGNGAENFHKFVLYLRSTTGDRRTIYKQIGPEGQMDDVHVQPAAFALKSILGKHVKIYALWDPVNDSRPRTRFSPILSSLSYWTVDVIELATHAVFVVADFEADRHGKLSQGVTWETNFLLSNPQILDKTLAIISDDDKPPEKLIDLTEKARWKVRIVNRNDNSTDLDLPQELEELISGLK